MFSSFWGVKIENSLELRITNYKESLGKTLSGFFYTYNFQIAKSANCQIARSSYAFKVSDLKDIGPKPKVNMQWKGNMPKSLSFTALHNPKVKYSISKNSTIILGNSLVLVHLLFFQLSLSKLTLSLGVYTNLLRSSLCPLNTTIVLWNESPKTTERKVKSSFT